MSVPLAAVQPQMQAAFLHGSLSTRYLPSADPAPFAMRGTRRGDDPEPTITSAQTGCQQTAPAGQFPLIDSAERSPDSSSGSGCPTLDFGR